MSQVLLFRRIMLSYIELFVETLSVFIGVGACGWPRASRTLCNEMTVLAFWKIPVVSASEMELMTCLRYLYSKRMGWFPLRIFFPVGDFFNSKTCQFCLLLWKRRGMRRQSLHVSVCCLHDSKEQHLGRWRSNLGVLCVFSLCVWLVWIETWRCCLSRVGLCCWLIDHNKGEFQWSIVFFLFIFCWGEVSHLFFSIIITIPFLEIQIYYVSIDLNFLLYTLALIYPRFPCRSSTLKSVQYD